MKAIAECSGVHYATVSRAVKDQERRDAADCRVARPDPVVFHGVPLVKRLRVKRWTGLTREDWARVKRQLGR